MVQVSDFPWNEPSLDFLNTGFLFNVVCFFSPFVHQFKVFRESTDQAPCREIAQSKVRKWQTLPRWDRVAPGLSLRSSLWLFVSDFIVIRKSGLHFSLDLNTLCFVANFSSPSMLIRLTATLRKLGSLLKPIEEQHKTTATDGTLLTPIKNLETESLEDICEEGRPAPWEECLDDPWRWPLLTSTDNPEEGLAQDCFPSGADFPPDGERCLNLPPGIFPPCCFSVDFELSDGWGDPPLLQDLILENIFLRKKNWPACLIPLAWFWKSTQNNSGRKKPASSGRPPPPLNQVGADEGDEGPGGDRHASALNHLNILLQEVFNFDTEENSPRGKNAWYASGTRKRRRNISKYRESSNINTNTNRKEPAKGEGKTGLSCCGCKTGVNHLREVGTTDRSAVCRRMYKVYNISYLEVYEREDIVATHSPRCFWRVRTRRGCSSPSWGRERFRWSWTF